MKRISKKIKKIYIYAIIVSLAFLCTGKEKSIVPYLLMLIEVSAYIRMIFILFQFLYNRKKIVKERKSQVWILTLSLFILNIWLLALMVWNLCMITSYAFKGISNFLDAVYFTIISFATVGYGDMSPVSAIAKIVVMVIVISNFLFLLVFFNMFVLRTQKKKSYIIDVIRQIIFMVEYMSSMCGTVNPELKKENHTIEEWFDIYCDILKDNFDSNQIRWKEIENENKKIKEENWKTAYFEEIKKISVQYINGRDTFFISELNQSFKKILESIEMLLHNRFFLLGEEYLTDSQISVLQEMKTDLQFALIDNYSSDIEASIDVIRAWGTKDLTHYLQSLGYSTLVNVKMNGYTSNWDNTQLILALENITTKEDLIEMRIHDLIDKIFRL